MATRQRRASAIATKRSPVQRFDRVKTTPRPKETSGQLTSSHAQALIAELVGTFALTFVAAGSSVVAHVSAGKMSEAAALIAPGLLVMTLIYTLGDVSGAHINPAVTLAFSLRGVFPWRSAFVYWLAQFVGAILAALLLRGLFGVVAQVGVTRPMGGLTQAFVMEIVATFLLVLVILGTADGSRLVGHNAGIAVGGVIALGGLLAGPISGASLNPARSLGPALAMGSLDNLWIYLLAPCLGATVAVGIIWLTRGAPPRNEAETATGDGTMGRS